MRARGRRPSSAAFSAVITRTAAAPSEICDDVPAVWTPSSAGRPASARPAPRGEVSRRPSSRSTVWVEPVGLPSSSRSGASIGTTWARSGPRPRPGRPAAATACRRRRVLAGDAPLLGDALGPLELGGQLVAGEVRLGDGPSRRPGPMLSPSAPGSSPRRRTPRRRRRRRADQAPWRGWWPAATSRTGSRPWWRRPSMGARR